MNNRNYAVLCFILLVYFVKQDAFADREDRSEEIDEQQLKLQVESNFSAEASGPPDSHEAMNNREIISQLSKSNREKRSYEFLMGLVNNNSKFEVTDVDVPPPKVRKSNGQMAANEALLELMVKIAADPKQWAEVHEMLQKLDNDLLTSKKLLEKLEHSINDVNASPNNLELTKSEKQLLFEKKQEEQQPTQSNLIGKPVSIQEPSIRIQGNANEQQELRESATIQKAQDDVQKLNISTNDQVQKMIVILGGDKKEKYPDNRTETAIKTNRWPEFEPEARILYKPETDLEQQNVEAPKYSWQSDSKSNSKTYPRNFAYHRVTGHPLYHNFDKNPKAYIAVSVIAPKPLHSRPQDEDLILENELRQLKPWTHKQNLKNMAAIRSRWVIQSENDNKESNTP